jgi:hypothetical protein
VDVWIQEEKPASTNESAKYRRMTKQSLGVLQQKVKDLASIIHFKS